MASFSKHFHEYARYCCHKRRSNYGSACGARTAFCTEDCNGETTKGAVLIALLHTFTSSSTIVSQGHRSIKLQRTCAIRYARIRWHAQLQAESTHCLCSFKAKTFLPAFSPRLQGARGKQQSAAACQQEMSSLMVRLCLVFMRWFALLDALTVWVF